MNNRYVDYLYSGSFGDDLQEDYVIENEFDGFYYEDVDDLRDQSMFGGEFEFEQIINSILKILD